MIRVPQKIVSRMHRLMQILITLITPCFVLFLILPIIYFAVPEFRNILFSEPSIILVISGILFAIFLSIVSLFILRFWFRMFQRKTVTGFVESISISVGVLAIRWIDIKVSGGIWRITDQQNLASRIMVGMPIKLIVDGNGLITEIEC